VDELIKKRQNPSLAWNDLYMLELLLTRLEPPEKLRRKAWSLRSRYRDVAGLQEYEAYIASKPPELMDQPDAAGQLYAAAVKTWRADIEYPLSELYLRYAIAPVRERQRNWLSKGAAGVILVGLVSVQQRLQNFSDAGDQLYNVSELMHAKSILVSAVSGATFANKSFQRQFRAARYR
jgi:hypothetical protein